MADRVTKAEIVNRILGGEIDDEQSNEELIHLLISHTVAKNVNRRNGGKLTFGQRVADKIAKVAGSWSFIFGFITFLILWIIGNVWLLSAAYDPYPFILLNLFLSCVAALQAPVIMMSQNRQEDKDRIRAENDYKVNLKAEIIIEDLHAKLDRLIENQEKIQERLAALEETANSDAPKEPMLEE
jgi:uncharacterized membrane protein